MMAAVNSVGLGSAEQAGGLDDLHISLACGNDFRRMIKREIEVTMRTQAIQLLLIQIVHIVMVKTLPDLLRKIAKEEMESAIKNFFGGGNWNNTNASAVSNERSLRLKFLDEVSEDVQTGKEIKGKGDVPIRVAIVDEVTDEIIESGTESSAKVEILFLEAYENDSEENFRHQDFNSRIIKESDKTKPHFARSYHVDLEKGIGALSNAKLANDSNWTKSCKCRLGARVVNLSGTKIWEAWTKPFMVSDSRGKLYNKHYPPSLSDPVWRLEKIGRGGERCERLEKDNISTVKDFLFWYSVDPLLLKEKLSVGDNVWKAIEKHAGTCNIDDERIFVYNDSSECNMSVVFDVVGKLKGIICDSQYVLASSLSKDEKDCTQKLLVSAFENQNDIIIFDDETTFMHQFPARASFAPTHALTHENLSVHNLAVSENANHRDPTNLVTSSQSFNLIEQSNAVGTRIQQVPNRTNYAAMNAFIQQGLSGCHPPIPQSLNHFESNEPVTSFQGIPPSIGPLGNLSNIIGNSHEMSWVVDFGGLNPDPQSGFFGHLTEGNRLPNYDVFLGGVSINELACMVQAPPRASDAIANASTQESFSGPNTTIPENIVHNDLTEPGTLSQSLSPFIRTSGTASENRMHQAPYGTGFSSRSALALEGYRGGNVNIPNNSDQCDQAEPGASSHNIRASTGSPSTAITTHVRRIPYGTTSAGTSTSIPDGLVVHGPTIPVSINHGESTEPDTSFQGNSSSISTLGETGVHISKRRRT